jgi:hypothetical protein
MVKKLIEELVGDLPKKLKVEQPYKDLRAFCNEKPHDARHAPIVGNEVKRLSPEDRSRAMNWACEILAACERHIRSKTAHK